LFTSFKVLPIKSEVTFLWQSNDLGRFDTDTILADVHCATRNAVVAKLEQTFEITFDAWSLPLLRLLVSHTSCSDQGQKIRQRPGGIDQDRMEFGRLDSVKGKPDQPCRKCDHQPQERKRD